MIKRISLRFLPAFLAFSLVSIPLVQMSDVHAAQAQSNPYAGNLKDANGNVIAQIGSDGVITDTATSLPVGKVDADGNVSTMAGKILGKAAPGNKLSAFQIAQKGANSGN